MICIHSSVVHFYLKKHTLFKDVLLLVGCRGTLNQEMSIKEKPLTQ